jgi:hypothetical protein
MANNTPAAPATIKKLVALDIVFHGARAILIEFIFSVGLCGALGAFGIAYFLRTPNHPLFGLILGLAFLGVASNYAGLLPYTVRFLKHRNAETFVASELADKSHYAKKYMLVSLLLIIPFAGLIVTIVQTLRRPAQ